MIKKIFGFILLGIGLVVTQYFIPQGEKKLPQETFAEINPIEFLIDKMDTPPEGLVIIPETTEELKAYFKASDENHVPRIFVDKLPTDFAQKGTNELWAQIISALILRTNEVITKERAILILLTDKFNHREKWTPKETEFFDYLVQKYDSKSKKTIQAKLNDLLPKIDRIPPYMAVIQSAEATNWGTENTHSPYEQMSWVNSKNYIKTPFTSLIKATDSYATEMNGLSSLDSWRFARSFHTYKNALNIGNRVFRWLGDYRQSDLSYTQKLYERTMEMGWEVPDNLSFIKIPTFQKGQIKIGKNKFDVELAKTPQEKAFGYMFRTKIPENTGMIFLESQPKKLSVWMKNTFLPLDILFFNGDKKITKILTNLKPLDETPFQSDEPVLGFVELPAGTVQKNKIEIGDKIKF